MHGHAQLLFSSRREYDLSVSIGELDVLTLVQMWCQFSSSVCCKYDSWLRLLLRFAMGYVCGVTG